MKRNTSVQLLRLLSEEEIRKLNKFLRSPYFNYSKAVITLFECLRKWHPEYGVEHIQPDVFWKKIHPGKVFSEQKYWALNYKLHSLIERFMVVEEIERNSIEFKSQLIKSHSRRNATVLFEKETVSLVDKIKINLCRMFTSIPNPFG